MNNLLIHWLVFTLTVIAIHLHLIRIKKKSPDKQFWLTVRVLVGIGFLIAERFVDVRPMSVNILTYIFSAWFLHDTLIALGLRERPWYLNNTGPIDKAQRSFAPMIWAWKAIAALTLIGMYFINDFRLW
jgi:hypothetical protein